MSAQFLAYLEELSAERQPLPLEELVAAAGGPERVAFLVVDLIKGFTTEGPLASPRIERLLGPAVRILTRARELGVRHFLFPSDSHPANSKEFGSFPPHCVAGTSEAELADVLQALPLPGRILPKRSLSAWIGTGLEDYLAQHPELTHLVVIGDCTDLCVYHCAMHLRLTANDRHLPWHVVVPAAAVDTYDLPVERAREVGALAHDADFLHRVFLYHMQLNGVQVVADLV